MDFKTDANGNIKNELKKVDHHVYKTNKNTVVQSPERIIAVKEAFVTALRNGGVPEDKINEVRAKLGIPAETKLTDDTAEMKKILAARFKPLTRQHVRTLLDRYAAGGTSTRTTGWSGLTRTPFSTHRQAFRRRSRRTEPWSRTSIFTPRRGECYNDRI